MRWKTTISFLSVLVFVLLLLLRSDKTSENSERDGRENSESGEKKAGVKLFHGMNKRYRPGDEPDLQINITVHYSNQININRCVRLIINEINVTVATI